MDQNSYTSKAMQPGPISSQVYAANFKLANSLLAASLAADECIADDFSISGCVARGCLGRQCKLSYIGTRDACRVFRHLHADEDIIALSKLACPHDRARLVIEPATRVLC